MDPKVLHNAIESSKDVSLQRLITGGKNPRGIPAAAFIVSFL